jgi:hypothetical protein
MSIRGSDTANSPDRNRIRLVERLDVKYTPRERDSFRGGSTIGSDKINKRVRQEDAVRKQHRQHNMEQPVGAVSSARVVEHTQTRDIAVRDLFQEHQTIPFDVVPQVTEMDVESRIHVRTKT